MSFFKEKLEKIDVAWKACLNNFLDENIFTLLGVL
jgi:hypothetical protein